MTDANKGPNRQNRKILIVEDSPTQAQRLAYLLGKYHYEVAQARNGAEALALFAEFQPALVISDVIMPGMDGYELCRTIKDRARDIRVILLTSLSDPLDVIRGLECGADNFISKPFDEPFLVSRLEYLTENRCQTECDSATPELSISLTGKEFTITADRRQILDLLLSTYEAAVVKNNELIALQGELNNWNRELKLIHQIGKSINHTHDLQELFSRVCRELVSGGLFGCRGKARVCLLYDDFFNCRFDSDAGELFEPCGSTPGWSQCGLSLAYGNVAPFIESGEGKGCVNCDGLNPRIVIPLFAKEKPIGVLSVASQPGYELDERQCELLDSLGHQLGMAVENIRLFEETRMLALLDPLTGLANRRSLEIRADVCLAHNRRSGVPFSVMIMDIDHFKHYNDTHGHAAGDRILVNVADIACQSLRDTDLAVRFGGEEFLLLLSDSDLPEAVKAAERLRADIEREAGVTVSIGIAQYRSGATFESVLKAADDALYAAKRNGRNRVEAETPLDTAGSPSP
jgi:diguanylate cyclase (GGDEF)-like protein